jgi:hypothetical protein
MRATWMIAAVLAGAIGSTAWAQTGGLRSGGLSSPTFPSPAISVPGPAVGARSMQASNGIPARAGGAGSTVSPAQNTSLNTGINAVGLGGGYGSGYDDYVTAATVGESYDRGLASIIRAEGQYNLNTSAAAINFQQAERLALANSTDYIKTYFQVRSLNDQYRAAIRGPRGTLADYVRLSHYGRPQRLTPSELDPVSGQLSWPLILQADDFTPARKRLDALFVQRADPQGVNLQGYLKIDQLTRAMQEELKMHVADIPPDDYLRARNFIESVNYEARYPTTEHNTALTWQAPPR